MKCYTLSICVAVVLIIVYVTSGLYTLFVTDLKDLIGSFPIQLTTATDSSENGTSLLVTITSSVPINFNWISLALYVLVVILIIILLCGIQCNKPCLVYLWTITMIVMLLADGSITIITVRQNQQKPDVMSEKMEILLYLMVARLSILLCGILITSCYYRRVTKARSAARKRQQMIVDDNPRPTVSPTCHNRDSWINSTPLLNPLKDITDDQFASDIPPPTSFKRTSVASLQQHSGSAAAIFQPRESFPPPALDDIDQSPTVEYIEDNRYNVPLQELQHHHQEVTNIDDNQPLYINTQ